MSKSNTNSCTANSTQMFCEKVMEIEQCLFPVPEEYFMRPEKPQESISDAFSESLDATSPISSYTNLAELLGQGLSMETIKKLCFSEMLLIVADDNIVGGLTVQVETIANEVVVVFCSSHFTMGEDRTVRSELLALTDTQFNPFQERKCETLLVGDLKQEKQLQLFFEEDENITAFRQETVADKCDSFEGSLPAGEDGMLIPDGLNILFMRYLVQTGFVGELHTRTINIEGAIGHCLYQISQGPPYEIDGDVEKTTLVVRTIFYPNMDTPEISTSVYLHTGHLLRHEWSNSKYKIELNERFKYADFPVDLDDLCDTMRVYLEELVKLLGGVPTEASTRVERTLQKPGKIVRGVLSEILREAMDHASTLTVSRKSSETSMSPEVARDILIDLINQLSFT